MIYYFFLFCLKFFRKEGKFQVRHFLVNLVALIIIALYVAVHVYLLIHIKSVNVLMLGTIVECLVIKPISDLVDEFLFWLEFEI